MSRARLLSALTLMLFVPGCAGTDGATVASSTTSSVQAAAEPGADSADRAFVSHALLGQQPLVKQLAELARAKSTNSALIALADATEAAQAQEAEAGKVLLVQWTGGEEVGQQPQTGPQLVDPGALQSLVTLRGAEFDTLWLHAMLNHHQGVIMMATSEIADGADVNAKTLAESVANRLRGETVQLQQILGGGQQ